MLISEIVRHIIHPKFDYTLDYTFLSGNIHISIVLFWPSRPVEVWEINKLDPKASLVKVSVPLIKMNGKYLNE